MEKLFLELLNRSITAGWLILAVLLVRVLFRRVPKWVTGCLWLLVAVRLLIPFSVESVYSLIPTAEMFPYEILYSQKPAVDTGVNVLDTVVNHTLESSAPGPGDSVNPLQIAAALSTIVWLAGLTVLLASAVVSYIILMRKVRTAVRLRENIRQSEFITTPFVLGVVRPTVYLPFSVEDADAEYIIAHEQTHIRCGHHLVKAFAYVLLAVYWFNPLMWLAYIILCRDIELACDERVIRNMSTDERRAYSTVLLEFSTKQKLITACPVAFGEVGVKTRVKSVLNYRKPAFWLIALALAACVVCGVCLLTDPKPIEGLPAAEEISRIRINSYPANREIKLHDTEIRLEFFLDILRTAVKTSANSYDDEPDVTKCDNTTCLKVELDYADETVSPSYQTYYLYSIKGKTYLERPYDAVYRIDKEGYHMISATYYSQLREETQDQYQHLNSAKMAAERELELAEEEKLRLEHQIVRKQEELISARADYEIALQQINASVGTSAYFHGIFRAVRSSIEYRESENMILFAFPDVPEAAQLDVTLTASYEDGSTRTVLQCDGNSDFAAEPGKEYSVTIAEGTTAITMHISADSTDGPCDVTFDLLDWAE